MARTTRAQIDELAQALSDRHGAHIWIQHSGTGYAIKQTVPGGSGAWEHAACLTLSQCGTWLAGALAIHSIERRATDPTTY